jgi:hypothetical protein
MGMYDTIRSSYDLGEEFTDVELQTKDIDCSMSHYWISPDGVLYLIDYYNTADFIQITEDDPEYNEKMPILNFKWVPNGNHGKVRPEMITKYVTAYTSRNTEKWTEVKLHFRYGKLQDFEYITYD